MEETILGIDLGTTNSEVAVIRNGKVEVLGENGELILPSVVGFDNQGRLLVGTPARNQFILAPERTVRSIKRKMGEDVTVRMGEQEFSPQEVSAIILRTLKERAERQLGFAPRKAVITVPAFFNEQQREATREAGELAGLEVVRIINEPTAASLNYEAEPEKMERCWFTTWAAALSTFPSCRSSAAWLKCWQAMAIRTSAATTSISSSWIGFATASRRSTGSISAKRRWASRACSTPSRRPRSGSPTRR